MKKSIRIVLPLVLALPLAAAPSGGSPARASDESSLPWAPCAQDTSRQCAQLEVPIDHAHPQQGQTRLNVLKVPASSGQAQGTLVLNPGGPGLSAANFASAAARRFPKELREHYDLVAFDPRGVGGSSPLACMDADSLDAWFSLDRTPDSTDEETALVDGTRSLARACADKGGSLLGHMSTEDAAKDMELLRQALGHEKLDYLGASYGTLLGATYADLFPARVGRFVLDGAMDPMHTNEQRSAGQARGVEQAFAAFAADCAGREDCALGRTQEEVQQSVSDLLARLDARPQTGLGFGPTQGLTESWATYGIMGSLYDQQSWPSLAAALDAAVKGKGQTLLLLGMQYAERQLGGGYEGNLHQALVAVNCLDRGDVASVDTYRQRQQEYTAAWPVVGRALAWSGMTCGEWSQPATGHAHRIQAPGTGPILVLGTTRDPATPYEQAESLAGQLENGHLLTREGDGHTAFQRGNQCIDAAVVGYLTRGEVPPEGTRC